MSELQPPAPPVRPQPAAPPPRDLLTPGMLDALQRTKPWVNLLAILGYVGASLLGLAGFGMFVLGIIQQFANGTGGMTFGLGILYLFLTIPYALGSQKLKHYANDIGAAIVARAKSTAVERALRAQQAFWKFAGITVIVLICFYVIAIPVAIIFSFASAIAPRSAQTPSETPSTFGSLFTPTLEKQKQTMADMRKIATALEARATDTNEYVFGLGPVSQIASSLEPTYIKNMPRNDAWGNPFIYQSANCSSDSRGCSEYYVASGGTNGKLERFKPEDYKIDGAQKTQSPDEDIVYCNGAFIRYPAAFEPSNN